SLDRECARLQQLRVAWLDADRGHVDAALQERHLSALYRSLDVALEFRPLGGVQPLIDLVEDGLEQSVGERVSSCLFGRDRGAEDVHTVLDGGNAVHAVEGEAWYLPDLGGRDLSPDPIGLYLPVALLSVRLTDHLQGVRVEEFQADD